MNLEARASDRLGPWYKALAEEPAHNRPHDEWGGLGKRVLKYSALLFGVYLALSIGLFSGWAVIPISEQTFAGQMFDTLLSINMGLIYVTLSAAIIFAVKSAVALERSE